MAENTKVRVGMQVKHKGRVYRVQHVSPSGLVVIHDGYEQQGVKGELLTPIKAPRRRKAKTAKPDTVNHPSHYTSSPAHCLDCGRPIECIDVIEHLPANLANAVKYAWRCDAKHPDPTEDLRKAIWYLTREIERRGRMRAKRGRKSTRER